MRSRELRVDFDAERRRLVVTGDVDERSLGALRGALATYGYERRDDLEVDLSGVTHLPSVAIGVLAVALKTSDVVGCRLDLVAQQGSVAQRTLEICTIPHRRT
ncbi:STAS domain-containing protein [Nocardioides sp. SYSU D00038]|uniref:STAS domain-containing protein n=1 Tax=Nocardioides sp. SYSU D00038 TaxID=2812554 RepID=UPI001968088E|nr:STAS domain-containing protein [Nocardioides sp. SYSU D00038]